MECTAFALRHWINIRMCDQNIFLNRKPFWIWKNVFEQMQSMCGVPGNQNIVYLHKTREIMWKENAVCDEKHRMSVSLSHPISIRSFILSAAYCKILIIGRVKLRLNGMNNAYHFCHLSFICHQTPITCSNLNEQGIFDTLSSTIRVLQLDGGRIPEMCVTNNLESGSWYINYVLCNLHHAVFCGS